MIIPVVICKQRLSFLKGAYVPCWCGVLTVSPKFPVVYGDVIVHTRNQNSVLKL